MPLAGLALTLALAAPASPWVEPEAGLPYLRFYPAREAGGLLGAGATNWAAVQDAQGVMLFANETGIVEYDGAGWRVLALPNHAVVRSLALDAEGTVWVGGQGELGRLGRTATGGRSFLSLRDHLPEAARSFTDVWSVLPTASGVYFSASEQLMRLAPGGGFDVWPTPGPPLRFLFQAHGKVYVAPRTGGLLEATEAGLSPLPANAALPAEFVRCVVPRPDGSLALWSRAGTFVSDGLIARPEPAPLAGELSRRQLYACAPQPDGTVLAATQAGGVLWSDAEGRAPWVADRSSGLPEDLATFAFRDRQGGVWLGLTRGLVRLEAPRLRSAFDGRNGIDSSVLALERHQGRLYAATFSGVVRLAPGTPRSAARFEPVDGLGDQTFALLSTESGLLAAGRLGVQLWRDGEVTLLHPAQGGFDLVRSRRDPALALAGEPGAVVLLRQGGSGWQVQRVVEIPGHARRIVEERDGRVWVGTETGVVVRLDPTRDPPGLETFDSGAGLPAGYATPRSLLGDTVFLTEQQPLAWDEARRRFAPDPRLRPIAGRPVGALTLLANPREGELWFGGSQNVRLLRAADGNWRPAPLPVRLSGQSRIQAVLVDPDGTAWVGTTEEVERHVGGALQLAAPSLGALLRSVADLASGEVLLEGTPGPDLVLAYERRSLRLAFALPAFDEERRTRYRTTLEGFDAEPSAWSDETHRDYTNLPEGRYTFRVEAKDAWDREAEPARLALRILPPWYRSPWAYVLWSALGLGFVVAVAQARSARLRARNRELQALVEARTREIRAQAEALKVANADLGLANEQLAHLNAEKNEFLGIVAHDLKNPLGAVRGYAELLQEEAGELPASEVSEFAGKIDRAARLMFDLVTNLLDVNRIEQGQMQVALQPVDLEAAARHAAATYAERAAAKGQRLDVEVELGLPQALADPGPLSQVVDNLVSNAVKYSPPDRPITLRVRAVAGRPRLEVQDRGPGLSPDDLSKLFGKFARLSAKPTGGEHSTGLGLAIVKRMVEAMGGHVWCESTLGAGATFVLELPQA